MYRSLKNNWIEKNLTHFQSAFFILILIGLIHYQLIQNINTHIIGRSFEDAFEVLWQLEWMPRALFAEGANPFFNQGIFYPEGWYLPSGAQPSWFFLLLAPVSYVLGSTVTYNLLHLSLLVGIAFATYLLVYNLTVDPWAGVASGLMLATTANLQMRLAGHTHTLFAVFFLSLGYFFFFHGVRKKQPEKWRWSIVFGLTIGLSIISHWYFLFIAPLPILAILIFPNQSEIGSFSNRIRFLAAGLGVSAVFILPFAWGAWFSQQAMFGVTAATPLLASDPTGIGLDALFRPQWWHPLWRNGLVDQIGLLRPNETKAVTLGFTAFFFAVCGLFLCRWNQTKVFWAIGLTSLLFAMGTSLYWSGQRIQFSSTNSLLMALNSWLLSDLFLEPGKVAIPLPAAVFYRYFPFFDSVRVFSRFVLPLVWSIAVLAGMCLAKMREQKLLGRYTRLLMPLVLGFVIFEGWMAPYSQFTDVRINQRPQVNSWLQTIPSDAALMEFPRYIDKIAMYNQAFHGQPIVNGYMSYPPQFLVDQGKAFLEPWPTAEIVEVLKEWDVQYVLVSNAKNEGFEKDILPIIQNIDDLCFVKSMEEASMGFKQTLIYKIKPAEGHCVDS